MQRLSSSLAMPLPFKRRDHGLCRGQRCQRVAASLVALLAFAVRVIRLEDANIWWDEGLAVWLARMPVLDMMRWTAIDVHPPLYFGLLHYWRLVAGEGEFAVRFLSAMIGVLTVAALWQLGRLLFPEQPAVALLGALFLALSRFEVWWSQEARMYMLGGLWLTLSLYFTVRLRNQGDWRAGLGYLITTIAALWTLYLLSFTLIIEGLYWMWTLRRLAWRERWRRLARWAGYQGVVLTAFLPWLIYAIPRMRSWSVQVAFDPKIFLELYATLLLVGESVHVERFQWLVMAGMAVIILGACIGWLRAKRAFTRDGLALLILAMVIPPAVVWFTTTMPRSFGYSPKPEARYLLPFTPPFYLLAAWGLVSLANLCSSATWRRGVMIGVVVVVILGQTFTLKSYNEGRYLQDDYKSIAMTLKAHVQPQDRVFLHTDQPWPVFAYHWPHEFQGWPNGQKADAGSVDHWLQPVWDASQGVWLVINEDALRADPQRLVEKWLADRALAQHEWRFGSKRLILFARTPERAKDLLALAPDWTPPPPKESLSLPELAVVGWEQPLTRVMAGDPVHVAVTVLRNNVQKDLHLKLKLGEPAVAEVETILSRGDGLMRQTFTLIPPAGTPSGVYPYILKIDDVEMTMGWVKVFPIRSKVDVALRAQPRFSVAATFGDPPQVRLLGYDLQGEPAPGEQLTLILYWRVEASLPISYKVFVHLIGADGRPAAQGDDFPLGGARPTTSWQPGETLVDVYTIAIPRDLPPGDYPLRIGFYDPGTGARLSPVLDANHLPQPADQIELDVLSIP